MLLYGFEYMILILLFYVKTGETVDNMMDGGH